MFRAFRRRAFTLVELLVVIGIIALLISILLPSLNKARSAAKAAACLSNLRQIGQGVFLYANRFNGALPLHNTNQCFVEFRLAERQNPKANVRLVVPSPAGYPTTDMDGRPNPANNGYCMWVPAGAAEFLAVSGAMPLRLASDYNGWQSNTPMMGAGIWECPGYGDGRFEQTGNPHIAYRSYGFNANIFAISAATEPWPRITRIKPHKVMALDGWYQGVQYSVMTALTAGPYGPYLRHGGNNHWQHPRYLDTNGAHYLFFDGHAEFSRDFNRMVTGSAEFGHYFYPWWP